MSSVMVAVSVDRPGYVKAAKELNSILKGNETLAVDFGEDGGSLYLLYPYLDNLEEPPVRYYPGCNTTYIISTNDASYTDDGYTLVGMYESETGIMGMDAEVPFIGKPGEIRERGYLWQSI